MNDRDATTFALVDGDVVQVIAEKQDFLGCFGIVENVQGHTVGLRMPRPMRRKSPMLYVNRSEVALIGRAVSRGPFGKQSAETHAKGEHKCER